MMMNARVKTLVRSTVGAALLLGPTLAVGCSSDDAVCRSGGTTHEIGDVYDEGCRQCTCNEDTSVTCRATAACNTGCQDMDGGAHDLGTFWPSGDGCNICQCVAAGEVECTTNDCGVSCTYDGLQRSPGSSFPATDGCNTCECSNLGEVTCTEMACAL